MLSDSGPPARIVLFGLEDYLATELGSVLTNQKQSVFLEPFLPGRSADG
jgi:hypothetical protein